ncbi:MAG: archaeosortase/exosortase family protein [Gemmatimonadota bacterium]
MHDAPLNARIGRTLPGPMFGATATLSRPRGSIPAAWPPLALLLAALWPHWAWMARRLTDGSDEPWGIVAVITVLVLVARDRQRLVVPSRRALAVSGALAILAAITQFFVPPIFAAGVAMLSLATFLSSALPQRPAAPLATLLLLALPVIASLQFYLGYPLRALTAHSAAPLLQLFGFDVLAAGASLQWHDTTVLVDPPCAGIGMLWVGSFVAALLSYLNGAHAKRTLLNGMVAAALVLAANVLRNAALFFPEAELVHWPEGAHRAIGLGAFALAIAPLVVFTHWNSK